jgi:hypothetical protein
VLWDVWGLIEASPQELQDPGVAAALDHVASAIDSGTPAELRALARDPRFAVPTTVTSFWPLDGTSRPVPLRPH